MNPRLLAAIDSSARNSGRFLLLPGYTTGIGESFARASSAYQQGSNGLWTSAAQNIMRSAHYHYDGFSYKRTILREGAGTNSALGACLQDTTTTYWNASTNWTITAATSCIAGQQAWRHVNGNDAVNKRRLQTIGTFVNGQTDCFSQIIENDATLPATETQISCTDMVTLGVLYSAIFTWSTKTIATSAGTGNCGAIDLGGGRYRIWVSFTGTAAGTGANGNGRGISLFPTGTAQNGNATILHHAQFEANASVPSSPIVTTTAAVTRAADLWSFAWPRAPEAGTWYVSAYDLNTGSTQTALWIGTTTLATVPYLKTYRSGGKWAGYVEMAAGASTSTSAAADAFGDLVELRHSLAVAGGNITSTLGQSINGAAEAVAAAGTARALDAAWAGTPPTLSIGRPATGGADSNLAIRSLAYVPGPETSMAAMRVIVGS